MPITYPSRQQVRRSAGGDSRLPVAQLLAASYPHPHHYIYRPQIVHSAPLKTAPIAAPPSIPFHSNQTDGIHGRIPSRARP
jgi:hypothetical protein